MKNNSYNRLIKILILSTVLGCVLPGLLIAQFTLSSEIRPRVELNRGYKSLAVEGQDASLISTQRTRLNSMFKNEYVLTKLVLQDVRQWGNQPQLVGNENNSISVHEAWAEVLFNDKFSLRAGRQELIYDDHRIFGNVGWAQQARSHDLALFKYKGEWDIHAGFAFHQNNNITNADYNGPDAYKSMQFFWAHQQWEATKLSLLFLNNGVAFPLSPGFGVEQKTKYSQTLGGRFVTGLDAVNIAANAYLQVGKDAGNRDLNAYNILFEASGKLNPETGITGGFEMLSGTAFNEDGDKNKSFTPFYGTNHKFNGFMDYFYVGNHINNAGLIDIYAKISHKMNKLSFGGHIHYFAAAADISSDAGKNLGTEIDLSLGWAFKPMVRFDFGWSTMFASENMQLLKGGDHTAFQQWGYVMLTVTPDFIK
ncbi:hypothetical protein SAMN06265379_102254 [Saccharicrinis carchari]|uniref:Alginate export n=1 Tax=Saccharicrinis carchari TaxID=1168039 RepID=A0A521BZ64_SACCC|nr:hypothetical protein [Saccharicrinis carchari]SMO52476.1 hypothetical protein SAMN06265379_102254 [Saccharicrinis carchari]